MSMARDEYVIVKSKTNGQRDKTQLSQSVQEWKS